jgi:hypothetical protein
MYSGHAYADTVSSLGHIPWLMDIVWHIPVGKEVFKLFEIAAVMIQKRSKFKIISFRDLVSYLVCLPPDGLSSYV